MQKMASYDAQNLKFFLINISIAFDFNDIFILKFINFFKK